MQGDAIQAGEVAPVLYRVISKLGLSPRDFSTHSFRSGKITDILSQGRSAESVRAVGRWKSVAQDVYNRPAFILVSAFDNHKLGM